MNSNDRYITPTDQGISTSSSDITNADATEELVLADQGGKYLYADYSPLEYNKNIIHMLNEYIKVCANAFSLQDKIAMLYQTLEASKSLQTDLQNKIIAFGNSIFVNLSDFNAKYKTSFQNEAQDSLPGSTLMSEFDEFFRSNIDGIKEGYSHRSQSFDSGLSKRINATKREMLLLFQEWLCRDYYELPDELITNSKISVEAFIDYSETANGKLYQIRKTITTANTAASEKTISYSFLINGSKMDFWNRVNKVSDIGIKDLLIPFGLRTPLTEKLKQTLRIVPGLSREPVEREPGFINADDYYIVSASMDQDKLSVLLASDPSELNKHIFRITYILKQLYDFYEDGGNNNFNITQEMRPRIDCTLKEDQEPVQDVLKIDEVANATDISKLILFGRALLEKLRTSLEPSLAKDAQANLVRLSVDNQDAIAVDEQRGFTISAYNNEIINSILKVVANCFRPAVKKAKEKSSMKDEIIIRYQRPDGSRQEYSAKITSLIEKLQNYKEGQNILNTVGITTSANIGKSASPGVINTNTDQESQSRDKTIEEAT
jgi:hypothetical protein